MDWRASVLDPALQTESLPGVGGVLRARLDDFLVEERPAYAPDGRAGHLFVSLRKRGLSTHEALAALATHLGIDVREIGAAGRKDRQAVTVQWVSIPQDAAVKLATFHHPDIELGPPRPHGHKLRMGHLRGNRFSIVIRSLAVPSDDAVGRARAKLGSIARDGGLLNVFGPQRFGRDGRSLDRGIDALRRGRAGARGNMIVAAGQAGLFNLWVAVRSEAGALHTVLAGDLLQKVETGGMFVCSDATRDQGRLESGEIEITGPIFGSRMWAPPENTPAAGIEDAVLQVLGVSRAALTALRRRAQGTRRLLRIRPTETTVEPAEARAGHEPGIRVGFALPSGSYATRLCAELQRGGGVEAIDDGSPSAQADGSPADASAEAP